MHISSKMRIGALITLAFITMMMTSLFTVGLATHRQKSDSKKTEATKNGEKNKRRKATEDHRPISQKFINFHFGTSTPKSNKEVIAKATYYNTKPHPKVHREHSTAAYYRGSKGHFYVITNMKNDRTDTVEITDCNGTHPGKIDLKEETFHKLTGNLKIGTIPVKIRKIEEQN